MNRKRPRGSELKEDPPMSTTAQHANVERARRAYQAFANADLQAVSDILADNIVWHVAGGGVISGEYKGKDAVLGFFMKLAQETGGTFKSDVHDILANDQHTVALVNNSAERNGKRLEWNAANISHTDPEGLVTEFWAFVEEPRIVEEFFS
jgi:ketosteroid isomerase-like protein